MNDVRYTVLKGKPAGDSPEVKKKLKVLILQGWHVTINKTDKLVVHTWMHQNVSPDLWAKEPILLVISLLLALMQDQVKKLNLSD